MAVLSFRALLLTLAAQTLAAPLNLPNLGDLPNIILGALHVKELIETPLSWIDAGAAHPDTTLRLQIALKHKDITPLQQKLLDISRPSSSNYGSWLSTSELESFTTPADGAADAVLKWLVDAQIPSSSISQPSPDWIEAVVPVSKAESLLDAKYSLFSHSSLPIPIPRTLSYSIPEALHDLVDTVQPTTAFYRHLGGPSTVSDVKAGNALTARQDVSSICGDLTTDRITPQCIRSFYNVDYTPSAATVAVTGFLGNIASHTDAQAYYSLYNTSATLSDLSVNGGETAVPNSAGSDSSSGTLEANLDVQIAGSLAAPAAVNFISVGPAPAGGFQDAMLNFTSYLTTSDSPPSSVATSYGDEERNYTPQYLDRACVEFMKAGARGISIFMASGDTGAAGNSESDCRTQFYPLWPSTCPWVTSVGGTQYSANVEQVAVFSSTGGSGGGFSNHFAAPEYQSADVQGYVASGAIPASYEGKYNASGRAYPDVALLAKYWDVITGGVHKAAQGTSASAPAWAGLVGALNDWRRSQGKGPLGFLNPLLYSDAKSALRDIVQGSSGGCSTEGWSAASGWDAATGLGSLDFAKLRALI